MSKGTRSCSRASVMPTSTVSLAERIRNTVPPTFDHVTPMPYVALQQLVDPVNEWGNYAYDKGAYFTDLSDEIIAVITDQVPRKSSPLSVVLFYRLDAAYCEVGDDDTAFGGGRTPRYMAFFVALCPSPELLSGERAWVRSMWQSLEPHMIGTGSYVNTLGAQEESRIREPTVKNTKGLFESNANTIRKTYFRRM